MLMRLLPLVLVFMASQAKAADTLAIGHGISNKFASEWECPSEQICMNGWFIWEISIDHTLAGPELEGRLRAAHVQHAEYKPKYVRRHSLFVLRRIEDEELKKTLGVEYQLVDFEMPVEMYCTSHDPNTLGVKVPFVAIRKYQDITEYCFSVSMISDGM